VVCYISAGQLNETDPKSTSGDFVKLLKTIKFITLIFKQMRSIFFSIIAIFLSLNIFAQNEIQKIDKLPGYLYIGKEKNEDFFKKSEFIFEGEVIKTTNYINEDTTKVYSSSIVKVTYEYKGNLSSDTIEFVRDCGVYNDENGFTILDYNSEFCFDMTRNMIFFAKNREGRTFKNEYPAKIEPYKNERYASLRYSESPSYHNFLLFGLNHLYFKTKEDFYKYAAKFDGVRVPSASIKKKPF